MTTIVFKDRTLYSDTRKSNVELLGTTVVKVLSVSDFYHKLHAIHDGACFERLIVGCSGSVANSRMFLLWTKHGRPKSEQYAFDTDFQAIEFDGDEVRSWKAVPAKKVWSWKKLCWLRRYKFVLEKTFQNCDFAAIGSGSSYAAGCLMVGTTATNAIVVASIMDSATNDDVEYITLDMDEPKAVFAGKQYELF